MLSVRRPEFELLVDEALADLPSWVTGAMDNLEVVVEEWPTPEQDPTGSGLLGLYEGVNLHDRASGYSGFLPDRITVFMGPHLELRLPPRRLRAQIRKTVLHEVAHHLGIDDERLGELGY
ncbi:MAG TPA: metallopeptidase family protein [Acidimicrobiia bacterium]|nr:metallopeptidase family protein [Acidimicrobiia bacterium]